MVSQEKKKVENYEQQINALKEGLQKARDLRNKALTQKEILEEQQARLYQKIREYGIEPEELEARIAALREKIEASIAEANALIPWELLQQEKSRG